MPIQHSSNFRNRMIGNTIALLEIAQERMMEVISGDTQKYVDVLFTSANLFAQEVEELRKDVDSKDSIIKALRADLDGTCRTVDGLRGEGLDLQVSNERLTRRVNELLKEVQILEERNHNQAIMLARKDRN